MDFNGGMGQNDHPTSDKKAGKIDANKVKATFNLFD